MKYLISFIFFIKIFFFNFVFADDNEIIFEINGKIQSTLDLKNRTKYLEVYNSIDLKSLSINEIINDFFSSIIFYEYVQNEKFLNKILDKESEKIYNKIINNSNENNILDLEIIKQNIKYDFARKIVIENILDNYKEYIFSNTQDINYIYNYKINYITVAIEDLTSQEEIFKITNNQDFNEVVNYLKEKNIKYNYTNKEINDLNKIDLKILNSLNSNKKYLTEKNRYFIRITNLNKQINSQKGVYYRLFNYESEEMLPKNNENCGFISSIDEIKSIREYEYIKLNDNIKQNLLSINDFIIFQNNKLYNYIFLCEIRVNEEYLKELSINKKINFIAKDIELDFLQKYQKIYNAKKYYE